MRVLLTLLTATLTHGITPLNPLVKLKPIPIRTVPPVFIPICKPCPKYGRCAPGYTCQPHPFFKGQTCCRRCPRVRKAWSTLSCAERQRYVNAVQALKTQQPAKFDRLVDMHQQNGGYAHGSAGFLPWHRWYLLQFETLLRSIRGYECISVPYWDSERDAGAEADSSPLRHTTMGHLDTHPFGTSKCVDSGIAVGWTASDGQCVRRRPRDDIGFVGEAGIASAITGNSAYRYFRPQIEGSPHAAPHVFIGGEMASYRSPDDPLFFVHHCNVDRWWAIWQDYYGYDEVSKNSLTSTHYYPLAGVDTAMPFGYNNNGDTIPEFSATVTPRDMHNIRSIKGMGYRYGPDNLVSQIGAVAGGNGWNWFTPANEPKKTCCGDGTKDAGEWCDDGNRRNGDGCSSKCFWEFRTIHPPFFTLAPFKLQPVAPFTDPKVQKAFVQLQVKKPQLSKAAMFTELAKEECRLHGNKKSATEEWKRMMNMEGQDEVFSTCAFPISKLPQNTNRKL